MGIEKRKHEKSIKFYFPDCPPKTLQSNIHHHKVISAVVTIKKYYTYHATSFLGILICLLVPMKLSHHGSKCVSLNDYTQQSYRSLSN